ncbi:MAG: beta-lactamase family protein [Bacteroidales bacterium]|nr:beta-lactamase family protein [Bacteroidales bacterium]
MNSFRKEMGNTGLAVVVVKGNDIVYHHNFGYANLETKTPLNDSSMFRIASISKSFLSTEVLKLVEEGKLSLDADVSKILGFPIRNPKYPDTVITLEMLLSHTSSINDHQGYFSYDGINPETDPHWVECYNDYKPGTAFNYCNLNYNLLGGVIECVTGVRFDLSITDHILKPLGIYGGYCVDSLDTSRFATLYSNEDHNGSLHGELVDVPAAYEPRSEQVNKYILGSSAPVLSPTGGMKISALGLAKYMIMHMHKGLGQNGVRILSPEMSKLMQTPYIPDENYGFALEHVYDVLPGVKLTGHTGGAYGLRSAMYFNAEEDYGFIVISNGMTFHRKDAADEDILKGSIRRLYKYFIEN